jgi:hypothetical protein
MSVYDRKFLCSPNPSLPDSDNRLAPRPPPRDDIPLKRRSKGPRGKKNRTRLPTPLRHSIDVSVVDETTRLGEGNGGANQASSGGSTFPILDIRHEKHNNRIKSLKTELAPFWTEDGSPVVLMCWGEGTCCSILPVPVPENEADAWREINTAWYTRRGYWRKYLPGLSVTRVEVVKVCYSMLSFCE